MTFGPLMVSLEGTSLTKIEAAVLADSKVGGVILFRENYSTKSELMELIDSIRNIKENMLIAVDHEGGRVQRFIDSDFPELPDIRSYGVEYDAAPIKALAKAFHHGFESAKSLLSAGININFAPVLDSHYQHSEVIGELKRAFHKDSEVILHLATEFAKGMKKAGMPVTGKHFPDHGFCVEDSHKIMPIDNREKSELMGQFLIYRQLIKNDLLDIVMPGHVLYPKIDANNMAGFSRIFLEDILRYQLEFDGVIISDCLSMGALSEPLHSRVNNVLAAGVDIAILSHQKPEVILGLLSKIEDNSELSKERLHKLNLKCKIERKHNIITSPTIENIKAPDDLIQSVDINVNSSVLD